jgi:hypothetical protein
MTLIGFVCFDFLFFSIIEFGSMHDRLESFAKQY